MNIASTLKTSIFGVPETGCGKTAGIMASEVVPMPTKDPDPKLAAAIGKRLTAFRKERGMTQVELAEKLDVTQALLSKYERGEVRLTSPVIVRLADVLGVSTDALLGVTKAAPKGPPIEKRLMKRLARFDSLPRRRQEALLQTIDVFLQSAES